MDLGSWLVAEHDDSVQRLTKQILGVIPAERRREVISGANSIDWTIYHIARHARLALLVLGHPTPMSDSLLAGLEPAVSAPDAGLHEVGRPWLELIESAQIEAYALSVLDEVRAFLNRVDAADDTPIDTTAALRAARIDEVDFEWLYRQWALPHFVLRWALLGHVTHHVGELTVVRNQMGISPFRS
ncbi:MAG: hypothetical protein M3N46_06930 [Actinomycetota bacterium]|nr:hypothetical protein [Actinomycetota bacterium]